MALISRIPSHLCATCLSWLTPKFQEVNEKLEGTHHFRSVTRMLAHVFGTSNSGTSCTSKSAFWQLIRRARTCAGSRENAANGRGGACSPTECLRTRIHTEKEGNGIMSKARNS